MSDVKCEVGFMVKDGQNPSPSGAGGLTGRRRRDEEGLATSAAAMGPLLLWVQDVVAVTLLRARRTLLRAAILLCVLVLLLWVSVFLYGSFYYSYMPSASFSTSVHFSYRTDCELLDAVLCSFPTANISFLKNQRDQVMMPGQAYRISLDLEMPESPVNEQLGMFMVKMSCYSADGTIVHSVARSAMLHYRSSLLQTMSTLLFSPFLLTGLSEQKQLIEVELFPDFKSDLFQPAIGSVIEIQSRKVQIYSAFLRIHAHFTGIRFLLYNFPVMSAVVGVSSNFTFLSVIVLFSYLQFIWGGLYPPEQVRVKVMMGDSTRLQMRKEDARKRMHSSSSSPAMTYRDSSEVALSPQESKQTAFKNKGELDTPSVIGTDDHSLFNEDGNDSAPIFLEALPVVATVLNEEDQTQGVVGMDNETHKDETAQTQSSGFSLRQRR